MKTKSIYVHIPFCISKCFYCDFSSGSYPDDLLKPYVSAVLSEISKAQSRGVIDTVYFGGGTPSYLPAEYLLDILDGISNKFHIADNAEITFEANPGTLTKDKLLDLKKGGFNRISIGMQSFSDEILKTIGRVYSKYDALNAFDMSRNAEFSNISIDLMYGLPHQDLISLNDTLSLAVSLAPEHISAYELSIEKNTPFGNTEELIKSFIYSDVYEMSCIVEEYLESYGYFHYEVSNYAKDNMFSRHNLTYWRNEEYFGFGAGAVKYIDNIRSQNCNSPIDYIEAINNNKSASVFSESLSPDKKAFETMMLGLRMTKGFNIYSVLNLLSADERDDLLKKIESMPDMLILNNDILKTTKYGARFLNDVLVELL